MFTELSNRAIQQEIGSRIKDYRIAMGLKQSKLAEESCVGINTIYKIEKGESVSFSLLLDVLRVLGLLDNLELLCPKSEITPLKLLELQEKKSKRVR